MDIAARIAERTSTVDGGCRIWLGSKNTGGYGQISIDGRLHVVHRLAYEAAHGPIGKGLQLDHLCRNRACCNPDHLEPVTPGENTKRGDAGKHLSERAKLVTHCPRGHEYTPENTAVRRGRRHCKTCAALWH